MNTPLQFVCHLQEVVGIVRAQLVGLMDGMKSGSIMEGHSWLEESGPAASEQVSLVPWLWHANIRCLQAHRFVAGLHLCLRVDEGAVHAEGPHLRWRC